MDSYVASSHIQLIEGTLAGTHPKSMTGYVPALKLSFEAKDTKHKTFENPENIP